MVTVLLLAVLALLVVPVQPLICQPVLGDAPLSVIVAPSTYVPALHVGELAGLAVGLLPCPVWLIVNA
jgi:hypothetical protein